MKLTDSHCHIHSNDYGLDANAVIRAAQNNGVDKFICVGDGPEDSKQAIEFADAHENCWASIGLHPHDAKDGDKSLTQIRKLLEANDSISNDRPHAQQSKVVAIGECGLDYHYNHSSKEEQSKVLHQQIELAIEHDLPLIFHVREAFDDFWPIIDNHPGVRGVVHSFTSGHKDLKEALSRDLFIGINGIIAFTKDYEQLKTARHIPLESLVLETDSPLLTPTPFRGQTNEPKHILTIANFLSELRNEPLEELAKITTENTERLYNIQNT